MIEVIAKLTRGNVYLSGELVECHITFVYPNTNVTKLSQSHDDRFYESLAWASAQIHCLCTIDPKFKSNKRHEHEKLFNNAPFNDNTSLDVCLKDSSNGDVIVTTKPRILFCDLRLSPGQIKTYVYREKIPSDSPPSFRGQLVKYSYKITIGMQRVNSPIKLLHVPLRVLPLFAVWNGQEALMLCNDTTEDLLSPANPFLEIREKETPFEMTLDALQNITARRNPNFYMISNTWGKVTRFCLFKSSYKLGEDIIGTFDFTVATVKCVQVSVSLQCEEETTLDDKKQTRCITYSKQHEVCLGLRQTQLILPIPLHVTPEFTTDLVTLRWKLHFEFVTSTSKDLNLPTSSVNDWHAPAELSIETMIWSLPIKLYSTTPIQVAQGLQSTNVHKLIIN